MASSSPHQRRNSRAEPPNICDSIRRFMALYDRHYPELQEIILTLCRLVDKFEKDFRRCTEFTRAGGIMGITGGAIVIAGLVLTPFTLGASAAVASAGAVAVGAGAGAAISGGIGSGVLNFFKINQQKKLRNNIKNGLDEFHNKIIPMADILKDICKNINEILRDLNNPKNNISGIMKCSAGISEIVRITRIDDIGEVAAQMSKTVHLTATITGVFTGVSLVLDILSVIEDNKALNDMDKLAGNHQISESEMKSKAGTFIVEMRKVIHQLQDIMDELQREKDNIARGLNQI